MTTPIRVSAATGQGVPTLLEATEQVLREAREHAIEVQKPQERRVYTLDEAGERAFTVTNTGEGTFLVTGVAIERLTRMTNFDRRRSRARRSDQQAKAGVLSP